MHATQWPALSICPSVCPFKTIYIVSFRFLVIWSVTFLIACYVTLHPALLVRQSVRPSQVCDAKFWMMWNQPKEWFLIGVAPAHPQHSPAHPFFAPAYPHYCPCPPANDCLWAVYQALFFLHLTRSENKDNPISRKWLGRSRKPRKVTDRLTIQWMDWRAICEFKNTWNTEYRFTHINSDFAHFD